MSDHSSSNDAKPQSFEDALQQLESIAAELESGSLPLEKSMQQFETAVGLLRRCYAELQGAEQRIQKLVAFDENGRPLFEDFDATATFDGDKTPASES